MATSTSAMPSTRLERMRDLIALLCSPACNGRKPGSPGAAVARSRILDDLQATGLAPFGSEAPGKPGFLQRVPHVGANIVGRLAGAGALAGRAIVIGAHYDHLGPAANGTAYWGADDNAAAVSILVETARALVAARAARPPASARQVIVIAFDGEEPPHFSTTTMGSMYWTKFPPLPLDRIDAMVCMDLCGHALGPTSFPDAVRRSLFVLGAERSAGTAALVDAAGKRARGVVARRLGMDVIPPMSDYLAFERVGVPSVFLTCGRWEHYHQVTDTPDRLDLPKVEATADFLTDLATALAERPEVPVRYQPDARDDATTATTFLELARAIAPHQPAVGPMLPKLEALQARAKAGPLGEVEKSALRQLASALEQLVG